MRRARMTSVAAAAALATLGLTAAPAQATPSSGVTATTISTTTVNGLDYILREITIQPGGYTGWHYHDGTLLAIVEKGTLTHVSAAHHCAEVDTYHRGDSLVEAPGANNVHLGRNPGKKPTVLLVLYMLPTGSPMSEDAADPGCGN